LPLLATHRPPPRRPRWKTVSVPLPEALPMRAPRCRRAGPATASHACPSLLPPTLLAAPSTHLLIEALRRPLESPSTPRRSSRGSPASTTWSALLAARRCGTTLRPNHSGPHSKSSSTTDTYGRPDSRQAPQSATGSNESTTDADATRPSVSSARSTSKTDWLRPHKPPDPVSTKRGQAQCPLCVNKLGFGGLPEHARCDVAFATFGAAGCRRSFGVMGGEGE